MLTHIEAASSLTAEDWGKKIRHFDTNTINKILSLVFARLPSTPVLYQRLLLDLCYVFAQTTSPIVIFYPLTPFVLITFGYIAQQSDFRYARSRLIHV